MVTTQDGRPLEGIRAVQVPVVVGYPDPSVTALMQVSPAAAASGLCPAVLTDTRGLRLCSALIPAGARVVTRGQRVFMHYADAEWRQIPVVQLGSDGRPI